MLRYKFLCRTKWEEDSLNKHKPNKKVNGPGQKKRPTEIVSVR